MSVSVCLLVVVIEVAGAAGNGLERFAGVPDSSEQKKIIHVMYHHTVDTMKSGICVHFVYNSIHGPWNIAWNIVGAG